MKPVLFACLLVALTLPASAQLHLFKSKKTTPAAAQDSASNGGDFGAPPGKTPVVHKSKRHMMLPLQPYYVLVGKVKGNVPVFMCISIKDSAVRGLALYNVPLAVIGKKKYVAPAVVRDSTELAQGSSGPSAGGSPDPAAAAPAPAYDSVRLFGTVEADGRLIFCSFSKDGNMEDGFAGKIMDDSVFQGSWVSMTTNKSLACQLFTKDTVPEGKDSSLAANNVDGTYSYHTGDTGPAGGIVIHRMSAGSISIDLGATSGAPDFASAMVRSASVPFDGETAIYASPSKPNCKLRIRVFKDFVVINYVGKMNQCGYGASVEGVFARTR